MFLGFEKNSMRLNGGEGVVWRQESVQQQGQNNALFNKVRVWRTIEQALLHRYSDEMLLCVQTMTALPTVCSFTVVLAVVASRCG